MTVGILDEDRSTADSAELAPSDPVRAHGHPARAELGEMKIEILGLDDGLPVVEVTRGAVVSARVPGARLEIVEKLHPRSALRPKPRDPHPRAVHPAEAGLLYPLVEGGPSNGEPEAVLVEL